MARPNRPAPNSVSDAGSGTSAATTRVKSAEMYILEMAASGLYQMLSMNVPGPVASWNLRSETVIPSRLKCSPDRSDMLRPDMISPTNGTFRIDRSKPWLSPVAFGAVNVKSRLNTALNNVGVKNGAVGTLFQTSSANTTSSPSARTFHDLFTDASVEPGVSDPILPHVSTLPSGLILQTPSQLVMELNPPLDEPVTGNAWAEPAARKA